MGVLTNTEGLEIPEAWRANDMLVLRIEPNNPHNNRDVYFNESEWGGTLSMGGGPVSIRIPWKATAHLETAEWAVVFKQPRPVQPKASPTSPKLRLVKDGDKPN